MKKIYSFLTIVMIICMACTGTVHAYNEARYALYTDVPSDHWAWDAIRYASRKHWVNGYSDGSFKPTNTITRAEVMKILVTALNRVLVTPGYAQFDDVDTDAWYAQYVESAKDLMLVRDNKLRPDEEMTREEAVFALVRAFSLNQKIQYADTSLLNKFEDGGSVSNEIETFMIVALQTSLISGYSDGTIRPKDSLTRAEFTALLHRAILISQDKY